MKMMIKVWMVIALAAQIAVATPAIIAISKYTIEGSIRSSISEFNSIIKLELDVKFQSNQVASAESPIA